MNTKTDTQLTVTEIQRFCMHDGPGIRTTVFLKGCPLRCAWCHNPETQKRERELLFYSNKCIGCGQCVKICLNDVHSFNGNHTLDRKKCTACGDCAKSCCSAALEICGKQYTIANLLYVLEKDRAFYGDTGGITLSGGEPFAQGCSAVTLLQACKETGLSTAIETSGYFDPSLLEAAVQYTDLFLWDIKDTDDSRHIRYTGVTNKKILNNLKLASDLGAKIRLRCILVNGINTDREHYRNISAIANSLSKCEGVELLPYHAFGGTKAVFLGLADNGKKEWIPTEQQLGTAKNILHSYGIKVL